MPQRVEFRTLLDSTNRDSVVNMAVAGTDNVRFATETGFHVYGELNLKLKLAAAADTTDAAKLLKILQVYTTIAETCASIVGAVLLEVQGERIHLLIPAGAVDNNSVKSLLKFSVAFTNTVYERIGRLAGEDFRGFKMAADHGPTIFISTGSQANASLISLSPAANAPAKQLRRADASFLRMRTEHYKKYSSTNETADWLNVVTKTGQVAVAIAADDLMQQFSAAADNEFSQPQPEYTVKFANRDYLTNAVKAAISESIKTQGFGFRADLDGFSKQVSDAFAKGGDAIIKLVDRFLAIMRYPESLQSRLGMIIQLPWAGDCANLIILPNGYGYDDAREFMPVRAASEWHSQMSGQDTSKISWATHVSGAQWSIGVAGGDDDEGSNGYILVAPLKGKRRDFLVAAGWGIGRSLDAQEADNVLGGDTVMHNIDYEALASTHQTSFSRLKDSTLFWVSNGLTKDKVRSTGASALAPTTSVSVKGVNKPVSAPKPWYGYGQKI
jgi:hypothetical protein